MLLIQREAALASCSNRTLSVSVSLTHSLSIYYIYSGRHCYFEYLLPTTCLHFERERECGRGGRERERAQTTKHGSKCSWWAMFSMVAGLPYVELSLWATTKIKQIRVDNAKWAEPGGVVVEPGGCWGRIKHWHAPICMLMQSPSTWLLFSRSFFFTFWSF